MTEFPVAQEAKRRNITIGDLVTETLRANKWNKTGAASDLGISRQALYSLMDNWNIPQKNPSKRKSRIDNLSR